MFHEAPRSTVAAQAAKRPRIRVAFLDHTAKLGGGEIALLNLVASIDRQQFEPIVILFSDGPLRIRFDELGVTALVLPLAGNIVNARKDGLGGKSLLRVSDIWQTLKFATRLAREIKRLRVDVVHTNSLKSDLIGGIAARLARVPLVWHVRDRIAGDYLPVAVASAFRMLAGVLPRRVIVNSAATLQTLCTHHEADTGGTALRKYIVVHDGTNVIDPAPVPADRPDSSFLIGLIGRISPWKGQDIFLRAAAIVLRDFPTARFQIVGSAMFGEDEYERQVRELARALLPAEAVEFTGFRQDVLELIGKLDLVVHASTRGEPFGQVILEGMAAGKAVVATNGGGVPEFVIDGQTGILVPMGDAEAMATAIAKYLGDPELRARAGALGRQRVIDHFTLRHTAQKIQQLFEDLLATAPAASDTSSASSRPENSISVAH
jgi:glycosyltransferase involved in cell wall biosynthesis